MGAIIAALLPKLLPLLIGGMWPDLMKLIGEFQDGKITEAKLRARTEQLAIRAGADVDIARAEAMASGFRSFIEAAPRSKALQIGWLVVVFAEIFVLFWYQWIVPIGAWQGWWGGAPFPSPGGTVEWAYALLGVMFVGSPLVFPKGRLK